MTRSEVAEALGVSEKTVARYVTAGRLSARYVRGKTGQQLEIAEADVERLKTEIETPIAVPTVAATALAAPPETLEISERSKVSASEQKHSASLARLNDERPMDAPTPSLTLSALARIVRAVMEEDEPGQARSSKDKAEVAIENKLLLSLDEAVALSGVPRAQLNAARRDGRLKARRMGRGYKVRREDLEAFTASLWES